MTDLLKQGRLNWQQEASEDFEKLKQAMMMAPVLALLDFDQDFVVASNASKFGIGVVLMQKERPVALFSTTLKGKNVFLSTYEKELLALALALAVRHWRPYSLGRRFRIQIDHNSIKYLLEQQVTIEMQQKWILKLMGYDFVIEYKQGKFNRVANRLSRKGEEALICIMTLPNPDWWDSMVELHEKDVKIKDLKEKAEKGEVGKQWTVKRGVLFYKDRVYFPEDSDFVPIIL